MSLLLAADAVTLYDPPAGTDTHGWALPATAAAWSGMGNLQQLPGRSDPQAEQGGGTGPFSPRTALIGELYLPPDAPVADGMIAEVAGRRFVLSQARRANDPTGSGNLDCWTATAVYDGVLDG